MFIATSSGEECRLELWRCLSGVVEGSLHYIDNPDSFYRLVEKEIFRAALSGQFHELFIGIPEVAV